MDRETLWGQYNALSAEARQQLDELIALLLARQVQAKPTTEPPLIDDPFVGMWSDREDLADSHAWVRSVREREWARPGG